MQKKKGEKKYCSTSGARWMTQECFVFVIYACMASEWMMSGGPPENPRILVDRLKISLPYVLLYEI